MQTLDRNQVARATSPSSTPSLPKPNAAKMRLAATALESILKGRVDRGMETPDWTVAITETLSYLTEEELSWIAHPREGLATVCKFLPQPADIHEFLREKRAKAEQFKPSHTHYRKLNEDHGPWEAETDFERKKRVVQELLGYNPAKVTKAPLRDLVGKEIPKDSSQLKTPSAPPSKYLLDNLEERRQRDEEEMDRLFSEDAA
jgi:hypothetical protein